jgi:5-methylcytosine-specific restriction endonuclease McrA
MKDMFKKSGNPKVEELTKSHRERSYNLSSLGVIKKVLEEGLKPARFCAWCAEGKLAHGNQKYCSTECSRSAMAWSYPQKEENLAQLLIRQNYKCNACQFDYTPFMDAIAAKDKPRGSLQWDWRNEYIWYFYKRLKNQVPPERKPEVDHVIPIYKGGTSLGMDNHCVLCYSCHKVKTGKDLSGKRK